MYYDIFNGDADGIFALQQYRLENPQPNCQLLTGVKRDIHLLSRIIDEKDCNLTVFDISLDGNRAALIQLLKNNNRVLYFDHHFSGEVPKSPSLQTFINPSPDTCTSMIVNENLSGKYCLWAICGAFGDNLHQLANKKAETLGLSEQQTEQLRELGELFNYNGYGASIEDLHYHPKELFAAIQPFNSPFDFIENSEELIAIRAGYSADLESVMGLEEIKTTGKNRVYMLPDSPWARRVSGVFSNIRARERVDAAHAIITENKDQTLRISVRAPLADRRDADTLCALFPTGGGRTAAAGINNLPKEQLDLFLEKFLSIYN